MALFHKILDLLYVNLKTYSLLNLMTIDQKVLLLLRIQTFKEILTDIQVWLTYYFYEDYKISKESHAAPMRST